MASSIGLSSLCDDLGAFFDVSWLSNHRQSKGLSDVDSDSDEEGQDCRLLFSPSVSTHFWLESGSNVMQVIDLK
jgi:hypothetical protein